MGTAYNYKIRYCSVVFFAVGLSILKCNKSFALNLCITIRTPGLKHTVLLYLEVSVPITYVKISTVGTYDSFEMLNTF